MQEKINKQNALFVFDELLISKIINIIKKKSNFDGLKVCRMSQSSNGTNVISSLVHLSE